ncbi:MAG: hypothetical protein R8J41_07945 [Alphaproteobacteria bacterium]|nr:hypothetical protein [Alphaproteobacteria bacterium]
MLLRAVFVTLMLLGLAACASMSAPETYYPNIRKSQLTYEKLSITLFGDDGPKGYKDEKIDDLTYNVFARGTEVSSMETASNVAFLRVARLGEELGQESFLILDTLSLVYCYRPPASAFVAYPMPTFQYTVRYGSIEELTGWLDDRKPETPPISVALTIEQMTPIVSSPDNSAGTLDSNFKKNWAVCN